MRSILKATVVLGFGSAISALFGLLTAKAAAVYLGPVGVGVLSLVQGLLAVVQLIGGVGLSASIVRFGAPAVANGDQLGIAAIRRAGWFIALGSSAVIVVLLLLLRGPISRSMLGGSGRASDVVIVAAVVTFSIIYVLQMAILNAHHRVMALATVAVTTSALGATMQILLFRQFGIESVPYAVAATAVVQFLVSGVVVRVLLREPGRPVSWSGAAEAVRRLIGFGVPYMASAFAGSGTQFLLPAIILAVFDVPSVGYFRASYAFSATYLGLILVSMAQDYFPRLSAQSDPVALNATVNQQFRILLLLGGPLVLAAMAFAPTLIRLVYSARFLPAVTILRWQLIGDIFKFQAWVLSFVVLAKAKSSFYLITEVAGGALLIGLILAFVRLFGLPGIGIGYSAAYLSYSLVVFAFVRRTMPFRWERQNLLLLAIVLSLCTAVRLLPDVHMGPLVFSIGIVPTLAYAVYCFSRIYHEGIRSHASVVAPETEASS
jgi:PST family polysaccharide transporter